MIRSFACADTEALFHSRAVSCFRNIERVARRTLLQIHAATELASLRIPPGNPLEALKANRKGQQLRFPRLGQLFIPLLVQVKTDIDGGRFLVRRREGDGCLAKVMVGLIYFASVSRDPSLDVLLGLEGQVHVVDPDGGYWVRFVVTRVVVSPEKPHGLDYSLTPHAPDGGRLVGLDNAHPVARQGLGEPQDHRQRLRTIKVYQYRDAATLVGDVIHDRIELDLELSLSRKVG